MAPTYYNTTDAPVIVDDAGHIVPGRESADLDARTPQVRDAVDRGELVKTSDDNAPGRKTDPERK